MTRLSGEETRALEPHVPAVGALLSPNTGHRERARAHGLPAAPRRARRARSSSRARRSSASAARASEWRLTMREGGEEEAASPRSAWSTPPAWRADTIAAPGRHRRRRRRLPAALLEGQLLLRRARQGRARLAPGLPGARARQPGRARGGGPRRPAALRPRRRVPGRPRASTTAWTRASAPLSRRPCAGWCPRSRTRTSSPTWAASGRSCRRPARAFRDFVIAEEPRAACPAWSTWSASTRPGSPPPSPSRTRWPGSSAR